jgi:hypothetical protein
MRGPDYTVKDLLFYSGLIGGIIIVYLALEPLEVHRLLRLLAGLVVGCGLGYVMSLAVSDRPKREHDPDRDAIDRPPGPPD